MEKKDLEKMTATKLREEAMKHPEQIKGAHGMNKEQLVEALMKVLDIPEPAEGARPATGKKSKKAAGPSKADWKKKIRALKEERRKANEAGDQKAVSLLRRRIRHLKHYTRKAAKAG